MTTPHPPADYAWSVRGWASEGPGAHPGEPELWVYADRFSYQAGDHVDLHVHTTAERYDLEIVRDGARPRTVAVHRGLRGAAHPTPPNAYEIGCGWPVALTVEVADDWDSGMYLVLIRTEHAGRAHEREGFFVVRAAVPAARIALVHTTGTLLAYNDWGGANHYRGLPDGHLDDVPAPVVSARRPVARGMLRKPEGAPRNVHTDMPAPGWVPRHPPYEWARTAGYSRHHADAFWATYERPFTVWAENNGIRLDHLTQHDLHDDVAALEGYACAVLVGHDEYWTWEMRDAVDRFTESGGSLARFAGNFVWQTRWDPRTRRQTCYKDPRLDPLYGTAEQDRVTTAWDWSPIARPPGESLGLSGLMGGYNRYGGTTPRSTGGYTVYRPHHWALSGTDLYYGDTFGGAPVCVAAFELDGADYTFRGGLPYPTGEDGAPDTLEIIAMTPAVNGGEDRWQGRVPIGAPEGELAGLVEAMYPDGPPPHLRERRHGAGMIATFTRGAGEVFNAGSTEWVSGLVHHDPYTERITHNVLERFAGRARYADRVAHPLAERM
ncbi:N,N-dimethylformamidase beta subunit family domain-containing protein [Streptomyces sp. NPDC090075]|uniref:N,N-dimethylformamidase beta subunit family domain-containing protein n=1 Tax=Streptomyces sp. NPDC090075 TaxID=3365937 RepID=UPI003802A096